MVGDRIDEAIEAAAPESRIGGSITLSTGRVVQISLPADLTDRELVDFIGWATTTMRRQIADARSGPRPRILVPV